MLDILAVIISSIAICIHVVTLFYYGRQIRDARERTDRAVAALLQTAGEAKAARLVTPEADRQATEPPDGRGRPRQIGLSPR